MPQFPIENDPQYDHERHEYGTPVPSRAYIQHVLQALDKPMSCIALCKAFGIRADTLQEGLRRRLIAMRRDGELLMDGKGRFAHLKNTELQEVMVKGLVVGHPEGYGWVDSKEFPVSIRLSEAEMQKVFSGDIVMVALVDPLKERPYGRIVEILRHHTWMLQGTYHLREHGLAAYVVPHAKQHAHLQIPVPIMPQFHAGDEVQVEILTQPSSPEGLTARAFAIPELDSAIEFSLDQARHSYQLPRDFPESVLNAAEKLQPQDSSPARQDLRHLPFVTIDGEDARDFDDAVYAERKKSGGWKLYVAIADVSFFVRSQDMIDTEAQKRSTSTYFPNYVIPMLPERLSNDLCSLRPDEDRFTLVCEMSVSAQGAVSRYQFYPAVIHSQARLTYTQVNNVLTQDGSLFPKERESVIPSLNILFELYKTLLQEREARGAIEFEMPEPVVQLDGHGDVAGISYRSRNEAHRLIEECMLLANVCAARFLLKHGLPGLYRVHEPPADDKLTELRNFLGLLGIRLQNTQKALEARDFNELVHQIRHRPDFLPLQYTLLRTLTQARYQPTNLGHFGLAYPAYTHFTSPIRRYPDLIVHRAIRYLLNYQDPAGKAYSLEALEALGIHTSAQERKADEASRLVMNLLKARYIEKHLGETFTGTISGITEFGFFVTLDDLLVDGLVHVKNLKDDYYRFQANRMVLEGEKSRQIFSLGQTVQVTIAKVDTSSGKIDFELQTLKPSKSVRSADPHSSKKAPEASGKGSKKPSKKDAEPSGQGPKRKTNRKK